MRFGNPCRIASDNHTLFAKVHVHSEHLRRFVADHYPLAMGYLARGVYGEGFGQDLLVPESHSVSLARGRNGVTVTAVKRRFAEGIALVPRGRGGRLVWSPVATDSYPWEGELAACSDVLRR